MENEKENIQHTQLPNGMGEAHLTPVDQYVYAILKSYQNKETGLAFLLYKNYPLKRTYLFQLFVNLFQI